VTVQFDARRTIAYGDKLLVIDKWTLSFPRSRGANTGRVGSISDEIAAVQERFHAVCEGVRVPLAPPKFTHVRSRMIRFCRAA
jgi:hypothetical protein